MYFAYIFLLFCPPQLWGWCWDFLFVGTFDFVHTKTDLFLEYTCNLIGGKPTDLHDENVAYNVQAYSSQDEV